MKEKEIEEPCIYYFEDGFLVTVLSENLIVDLEVAKRILALRLEISNGKSYPVLADYSRLKQVSKEARDYMGTEQGSQYITAAAMIVKSRAASVIMNFFFKVNHSKNKVPTKLFHSREKAVAWLEQYK